MPIKRAPRVLSRLGKDISSTLGLKESVDRLGVKKEGSKRSSIAFLSRQIYEAPRQPTYK